MTLFTISVRTQNNIGTEENNLEKVLEGVKPLVNEEYQRLYDIYRLDVFRYYNLHEEYNTGLKKETFKKTEEYKDKLRELKDIKEEMLNTYYYVVSKGYLALQSLSDYDIKQRGFKLTFRTDVGVSIYDPDSVAGIDDVLFPTLPAKTYPVKRSGACLIEGAYKKVLFLPMSSEKGLVIENNKEDIQIYMIFKISGVKSVQFRIQSVVDGTQMDETEKFPYANSARLIIANGKKGDVYFDKFYEHIKK